MELDGQAGSPDVYTVEAVVLNAGGDKRCIVDVGLDFAGMGFYLLRVDVRTDSDEGVEQPREEKRRGLSGAGCDAGTTT